MEEGKFYYIRSKNNDPVVTVCLIKREGEIGRGVSICSLKDGINKKAGRKHALAFARRALGTKKHGEEINRDEAIRALLRYEVTLPPQFEGFKSTYNPTLTEYEQSMLEKAV